MMKALITMVIDKVQPFLTSKSKTESNLFKMEATEVNKLEEPFLIERVQL